MMYVHIITVIVLYVSLVVNEDLGKLSSAISGALIAVNFMFAILYALGVMPNG